MYVLIQTNETNEENIVPVMTIETESVAVAHRYLQGYCLRKIQNIEKNENEKKFTDYFIEQINQLNNQEDGYYLTMLNNTVEIYHKTSTPNGWIFNGETIVTKLYSITCAKCDNTEKSMLSNVNDDVYKNIHQDKNFMEKLEKRRCLISGKTPK